MAVLVLVVASMLAAAFQAEEHIAWRDNLAVHPSRRASARDASAKSTGTSPGRRSTIRQGTGDCTPVAASKAATTCRTLLPVPVPKLRARGHVSGGKIGDVKVISNWRAVHCLLIVVPENSEVLTLTGSYLSNKGHQIVGWHCSSVVLIFANQS
ncbi:hypothetical protein TYRP_002657 [Tyrophagus putrescentiae]|nr:hypothetical protein TYRP_002657 [Tyrophagus putrescentiae]